MIGSTTFFRLASVSIDNIYYPILYLSINNSANLFMAMAASNNPVSSGYRSRAAPPPALSTGTSSTADDPHTAVVAALGVSCNNFSWLWSPCFSLGSAAPGPIEQSVRRTLRHTMFKDFMPIYGSAVPLSTFNAVLQAFDEAPYLDLGLDPEALLRSSAMPPVFRTSVQFQYSGDPLGPSTPLLLTTRTLARNTARAAPRLQRPMLPRTHLRPSTIPPTSHAWRLLLSWTTISPGLLRKLPSLPSLSSRQLSLHTLSVSLGIFSIWLQATPHTPSTR